MPKIDGGWREQLSYSMLIIECIWCSRTRMYPLWNATHIWPIWPSWRVEPDTGREVSRAPASCDLSSMPGLSTQLLEERCSLGCWETKTLTFTTHDFPTRTFNHWSRIQSVSSVLLRHVGWCGSLRAETIWWSTHQPEPSAGQNWPGSVFGYAAIACLSLQRPFLVGWISASGVHSSSILVAPDVSIVYQDKAWKLGDLKMRFPMFCLIRSHSFRSSNFDALQGPILMISRVLQPPQPFVKTYWPIASPHGWSMGITSWLWESPMFIGVTATINQASSVKSIPMVWWLNQLQMTTG